MTAPFVSSCAGFGGTPDAFGVGLLDDRLHASDFRGRNVTAERRKPVITPTLVVQTWIGTLLGLEDQTVGEQPADHRVECPGAERDGSRRPPRDFLDDGIAVLVAVRERQQHVERRRRQWQQ